MDRGEGVYERVERPYVRFIDWQQQRHAPGLLLGAPQAYRFIAGAGARQQMWAVSEFSLLRRLSIVTLLAFATKRRPLL